MFSNKDLSKLIIPLIVEQLLATTIGLADTVMVSSCGEAAVSGVSLVDQINFLFITLFAALATGGAIVSSQYIGKGDREDAKKAANQLFYVALFLSGIIAAVCMLLHSAILSGLYGQVEKEVMDSAKIYFLLTAASYPFLAIYNSGAALFRSMGDSRTSMYTSLVMNGINVAGNALLIYVVHMGVSGAATATLVSRIIGCVFITALLHSEKRPIAYGGLLKFHFEGYLIKKILYIGIPSGVENSMFQIGKIIVASLVAVLGTASITANAVCGSLAGIEIVTGTACGMAMVTVVGQCVGAGRYDLARSYIKKLMGVCYVGVWITVTIMLLLRGVLFSLYGLSDETLALANQCFLVHSICCYVTWPLSFALPNALRAANDVKYPMYVSLCSMIFLRVVLTFILIRFFHVGIVGVWVAMCTDWALRAVLFVKRILGDRWTVKKLV